MQAAATMLQCLCAHPPSAIERAKQFARQFDATWSSCDPRSAQTDAAHKWLMRQPERHTIVTGRPQLKLAAFW